MLQSALVVYNQWAGWSVYCDQLVYSGGALDCEADLIPTQSKDQNWDTLETYLKVV